MLRFKQLKDIVIGKARPLRDPEIFHKMSLIAFFAWVGLGVDGLTSSCYGPEEAFLALKSHIFLGIFVAIATAVTIFVISASYSQIVELFPSGGGGYLVASKLLSPSLGMVSGCALLIDYVLTITLSIASGSDALFSFLPYNFQPFKIVFATAGVLLLVTLNLRGVKESVLPLVPIFLLFLATHVFIIIYALATHLAEFGTTTSAVITEVRNTQMELGLFGMFILIMRSYSMGAGTYTGIEAVSNGIPMLREPKVKTAKTTMAYMAFSLAFLAVGLMLGYLLYRVEHQPGKTLNAVLFEHATAGWNAPIGGIFVLITLISEAIMLFVAAQTGFLGGPRVLSNMAIDRWFPSQFSLLSERFVIKNGILLMGGASLILMVLSRGSVKFLVVLYSINVFITFFLSQLGMVRHWWSKRSAVRGWIRKLLINTTGLVLTTVILFCVVIIKFHEGGWITILITSSLIGVAITIKRYYYKTLKKLKRLDKLIDAADFAKTEPVQKNLVKSVSIPKFEPEAKTAVIVVNGFNGMGLHTLFNVIKSFGDTFRNFFFIQVGIADAGSFKGKEEVKKLEEHVHHELNRYVAFMQSQGFYAESFAAIDTDATSGICELARKIFQEYPNAVFFGGQIVFKEETFLSKLLYNHTVFVVQRRLHQDGIPYLIMPIRVN